MSDEQRLDNFDSNLYDQKERIHQLECELERLKITVEAQNQRIDDLRSQLRLSEELSRKNYERLDDRIFNRFCGSGLNWELILAFLFPAATLIGVSVLIRLLNG